MWKIIRDHAARGGHSLAGRSGGIWRPPGSARREFRLLDADGSVLFHGWATRIDGETGDEPLTQLGVRAGAVTIQYDTGGQWRDLEVEAVAGSGTRTG